MDTSPVYVQMCRQAKEIQETWKPAVGDFYNSHRVNVVCTQELIEAISSDIREHRAYTWVTWLPRQDQIMELLGYTTATPLGILDGIWMTVCSLTTGKNKCKLKVSEEHFVTESFEEFLLKVLVADRWGKVWNGDDWVKE